MSHAYDIKARKHALHTVRAWAAKGYQPIYLSGRQGSYYNLTLGKGGPALPARACVVGVRPDLLQQSCGLRGLASSSTDLFFQCCVAASGLGRSVSSPGCLTVAPGLGQSSS